MTSPSDTEALGRLAQWCDRFDPKVTCPAGVGPNPHDLRAALDRIAALEAENERAFKALKMAHSLLDLIEQRRADNCWWVNASDPESAVCDTLDAVTSALQSQGNHHEH